MNSLGKRCTEYRSTTLMRRGVYKNPYTSAPNSNLYIRGIKKLKNYFFPILIAFQQFSVRTKQ